MISHYVATLRELGDTDVAALAKFEAVEKTVSNVVDRALALRVLVHEQKVRAIHAAAGTDWRSAAVATTKLYEHELDTFAASPYGRLVQATLDGGEDGDEIVAERMAKKHELGYYVALTNVVIPALTRDLRDAPVVAKGKEARARLFEISRLGMYPFAIARDVYKDATLIYALVNSENARFVFERMLGALAKVVLDKLTDAAKYDTDLAPQVNTARAEFLIDATPFLETIMTKTEVEDLQLDANISPQLGDEEADAFFRELHGAVIVEYSAEEKKERERRKGEKEEGKRTEAVTKTKRSDREEDTVDGADDSPRGKEVAKLRQTKKGRGPNVTSVYGKRAPSKQ